MKKIVLSLMIIASAGLLNRAQAQFESVVMEGELGLSLGAAHYFGDINTRAKLNRPKIAVGGFFRKQISNYVALRVSAHYAKRGYSDHYNKTNDIQRRRN